MTSTALAGTAVLTCALERVILLAIDKFVSIV
jgi:hypothetical protein